MASLLIILCFPGLGLGCHSLWETIFCKCIQPHWEIVNQLRVCCETIYWSCRSVPDTTIAGRLVQSLGSRLIQNSSGGKKKWKITQFVNWPLVLKSLKGCNSQFYKSVGKASYPHYHPQQYYSLSAHSCLFITRFTFFLSLTHFYNWTQFQLESSQYCNEISSQGRFLWNRKINWLPDNCGFLSKERM